MAKRATTRERMVRLVREFEGSGLTGAAFCRRHGLRPQRLRRLLRVDCWASAPRACDERRSATIERPRERLPVFARECPRYGYRRWHVLLRPEGDEVNQRGIHPLCQLEALMVRRRGRKRIAAGKRVQLPLPSRVNERWSLDFVSDQLAHGRVFCTLNIVDDFTRECRAIEVDTPLTGRRVARVLL